MTTSKPNREQTLGYLERCWLILLSYGATPLMSSDLSLWHCLRFRHLQKTLI